VNFGEPGCENWTVCNCVCGKDPFCCESEWDQGCADTALNNCGLACPKLPPPRLFSGPVGADPAGAAGHLEISPDAYGAWHSNGFLPINFEGNWNDSFTPTGFAAGEVSFSNGFAFYAAAREQRQFLTSNGSWIGVADDTSLDIEVVIGDDNDDDGEPDVPVGSDTNGDGLDDHSEATIRVFGGTAPNDTNVEIEVINQVATSGVGPSLPAGVGLMTQTLNITNLSANAIAFNLLRQFDVDLLYVGDAADDSVGTLTNDACDGDLFVYQDESTAPGTTAIVISSPHANGYSGGKAGCDPDGAGSDPAYAFGTDLQEWDAFGLPVSWVNNIGCVGTNVDGDSGAMPPGSADPLDCHIDLNIPVGLQGGASTTVVIHYTYGQNFPAVDVTCGAEPCDGDTNGDNVVDVQDLVNVITNWNTANPGADVNDDNIVDVQDLVLVVTNWGPC
jgi:hypothetical protein